MHRYFVRFFKDWNRLSYIYNHLGVIHKGEVFTISFALLSTLFLILKLILTTITLFYEKDANKQRPQNEEKFLVFCYVAWLKIQSLLKVMMIWGLWTRSSTLFTRTQSNLFIHRKQLKMIICWYFTRRESINMVIFWLEK